MEKLYRRNESVLGTCNCRLRKGIVNPGLNKKIKKNLKGLVVNIVNICMWMCA